MSDWTVEVSVDEDRIAAPLAAELAEVARWTLAAEEAGEVELSIALLDDESIAGMNRDYLAHEGPTDVISFPLEHPGLGLFGDVYIGVDQAERQAAEHGVTAREELLRLAIHGTLHVLGWEHPDVDDRSQTEMYLRQEELLASFLSRS